MSGQQDDRGGMQDAVDTSSLPVARPTGPQTMIIDQRPKGAIRIEVPRDDEIIFKKLKVIATRVGDDFFYRWPVKNKDGSTEWVEGPSVKCANAVSRIYGNNLTSCLVQDTGTHFMFTARFYDMETGYGYERCFRQRKTQNIGGKMDKDRAEDIVFQIGQSKAIRNVVTNALAEYCDYALFEAKQGIVEKIGKQPEVYRARIRARLEEFKVDVARVEARIGRSMDKWLAPDMAAIVAEIQTINDGMADADELWPQKVIPIDGKEPTRQEFKTSADTAAKTADGKAFDPPAEETKTEGSGVRTVDSYLPGQVEDAIGRAAAADLAALEVLDDEISAATHDREDLRAKWNVVYRARKTALEAKPAASVDQKLEEGKQNARQVLDDYITDEKKKVDAAKTTHQIDLIEDEVVAQLGGTKDPDAQDFVAYCNAKARSLSRKK